MEALEIEDIVGVIIGHLDMSGMHVCRCVNKLFMKVANGRVERTIRDDRIRMVQNWFKHTPSVARWICVIGKFTREEMMANGDNGAFIWLCTYGHLNTAQWIDWRFNFTREEITADGNSAFHRACWKVELAVAQWLDRRCNFTREELMDALIQPKSSDIEFIEWLETLAASR